LLGRKEERKERRKEGRKEGRKKEEGYSQLMLIMMLVNPYLTNYHSPA